MSVACLSVYIFGTFNAFILQLMKGGNPGEKGTSPESVASNASRQSTSV
jgi:hypothetical protein